MKFTGSPLYVAILLLCYLCVLVLSEREYYKILGVKTTAKPQEIKKAFRKLSQKYHPDISKERDAVSKFQEINHAYEVLSDPEKRRIYDQQGEEGLKRNEAGGQGGGMDPFGGIFDSFFGGGGRHNERKGADLFMKIQVSLEDIYNGREIDVFVTKRVICPHCRGTGADNPEDVKQCPDCGGSGRVIKRQQIAPGFFQQFQSACDRCGGKGVIFSTQCHVCRGTKLVEGMDEITLFIEKGIPNGHELRFPRAHEEHADMAPSDILFKIIEIPHKTYRREGNDLRTVVWITLEEALLGFHKELTHMDGHKVVLERSQVTQPGEVEKKVGEGMPHHEFSSHFGDLFVEYQIVFPAKFTEEQNKLWQQFFKNKD